MQKTPVTLLLADARREREPASLLSQKGTARVEHCCRLVAHWHTENVYKRACGTARVSPRGTDEALARGILSRKPQAGLRASPLPCPRAATAAAAAAAARSLSHLSTSPSSPKGNSYVLSMTLRLSLARSLCCIVWISHPAPPLSLSLSLAPACIVRFLGELLLVSVSVAVGDDGLYNPSRDRIR